MAATLSELVGYIEIEAPLERILQYNVRCSTSAAECPSFVEADLESLCQELGLELNALLARMHENR